MNLKVISLSMRTPILVLVFVAASFGWTTPGAAQELVPRAYWPAPHGTDLIVVGYQHSDGDVVTDATVPLTGVDRRPQQR